MSQGKGVRALFGLLDGEAKLAVRGYKVCLGNPGELAVKWNGHLRGVWRSRAGSLSWIPAGHSAAAHKVTSAEEAAKYTFDHIVKADGE